MKLTREAAVHGRYVVGVDESMPSRAAVRWAAQRAERDGVPLLLVHVRDPENPMMGDRVRGGFDLLDRLKGLVGRGIDVSTQALDGPVPWTLARAVAGGDVLVVGTHKIGFVHGRVLGSRAMQIAFMAPCSIAVIPDIDLRFRRGVVAGVDRRETAAAIAHAAAIEAHARNEDLVVIQSASGVGDPDARAMLPISLALAEARAAFPSILARSRIAGRPAAEALLDAARDKALLVLGPGSTDGNRSPIGSVLHDVLLNLNAPVLVTRPVPDKR